MVELTKDRNPDACSYKIVRGEVVKINENRNFIEPAVESSGYKLNKKRRIINPTCPDRESV